MYRYITIRGDDHYQTYLPFASLDDFLKSEPSLVQQSDTEWKHANGLPFLVVGLHNADSQGNYPGTSEATDSFNMVEIISPDDGRDATQELALSLGVRIAQFLGWELILEDE